MPWRTVDVNEQRVSFVVCAKRKEKSFARLCEEFGISRPTGYTWWGRFREDGVAGVVERSRRPLHRPNQTPAEQQQRVIELRGQRPDWGARKLQVLLRREGLELPRSTIHRILLRHGLVRDDDRHPAAGQRFERAAPNQLWQMDFKSPKGWDHPVGPLSVLDDHSRYAIALEGTWCTQAEPVRERLETAFQQCGVPEQMLMDHGTPWWSTAAAKGWTRLTVWLMKQGIQCLFSGYRHPQTQGKVERFHGALEMARRRRGLPAEDQRQAWLDQFRYEYNHLRPHEALSMQTPASVWYPSQRRYEPNPAPWEYPQGAEVRKLGGAGQLKLAGRRWDISLALANEWVRLVRIEQRILVYYCQTLIRELDLADQRSTAVDRWSQPCNCKGCPENVV